MHGQVTIQGLKCTYKIKGNGRQSIVLLHGWGQSLAFWEHLTDRLSLKYKTYVFDLPGWGTSQEPSIVWDVAQYANFVQDFLTHFNIKEPILLGHSFGGRIALNYALRFHTKKLVLYSSPGVAHISFMRWAHGVGLHVFRVLAPNTIYRMHSDCLKHSSYVNTYQISSSRSRRMIDIYIHNSLKREKLPDYNEPVLLIYGSADKIVPSGAIQKLQSQVFSNNVKTVVVKGATHFSHLEAPETFYKHLSKFLDTK